MRLGFSLSITASPAILNVTSSNTTNSNTSNSYQQETANLFLRMAVQPPDTVKSALDQIVVNLKSNNIWQKGDVFYLFRVHDYQAATLDWLNGNRTANAVFGAQNTLIHYPYKFLYGNGHANTVLNTNWWAANQSTQNFKNTDHSIVFWHEGGSNSSAFVGGAFTANSVLNRVNFLPQTPSFQTGVITSVDTASNTLSSDVRNIGVLGISRSSNVTHFTMFARGAPATSIKAATANAAIPTEGFPLFAVRNLGSSAYQNHSRHKLCAFFAGSNLSPQQHLAFHQTLSNYANTLDVLNIQKLPQPIAAWGDSLTFNATAPNMYLNQWREMVAVGNTPNMIGVTGGNFPAANINTPNPNTLFRIVFNGGIAGETANGIKTRMFANSWTHNTHIHIIWAGRNGFNSNTQVVDTLANIASMVSLANSTSGKWLVLGVTNGCNNNGQIGALQGSAPNWEDFGTAPYNFIKQINDTLEASYGNRFIDIRRLLVEQGNASEISRNVVPISVLTDSVHMNSNGHYVVANAILSKLNQFGW